MPSLHDPGGKVFIPWTVGARVTSHFSTCQRYRYALSEIWDDAKPLVMWLLMNPSTADMQFSDRTLAKTGKFAREWGYGGQLVGNVHAYRATYPRDLRTIADPVGPENDAALCAMAEKADVVVLAYGKPPTKALCARGPLVTGMLAAQGAALTYLALTKDRTPGHPLYLPGTTQLKQWPPVSAKTK